MSISRREFLLSGSAASALWLTGCGGGGSADGAPKAGSNTTTATACTLAQNGNGAVNSNSPLAITFSQVTGTLPHASTPMTLGDAPNYPTYMACTNPYLPNQEGFNQELFINIVDTPVANVVRSLRLHLAIPKDPSTTNATRIQAGYVFTVGDPTNPGNCGEVFSGVLVINDLAAGTNYAYQITSGTVDILDDGYGLVFTAPIRLTGVVASATSAGGSNNHGTGTVQMDGMVDMNSDFLTDVVQKAT